MIAKVAGLCGQTIDETRWQRPIRLILLEDAPDIAIKNVLALGLVDVELRDIDVALVRGIALCCFDPTRPRG